MAKFYGPIGFAEKVQSSPGVWTNKITDRNYSGDVIKTTGRWNQSTDSTNDDLTIDNQISIISDPYAEQNFRNMKYVEFMGTKWKVKSAEVKYPRLILSLGGVYNG